jgi:hypothetical protein
LIASRCKATELLSGTQLQSQEAFNGMRDLLPEAKEHWSVPIWTNTLSNLRWSGPPAALVVRSASASMHGRALDLTEAESHVGSDPQGVLVCGILAAARAPGRSISPRLSVRRQIGVSVGQITARWWLERRPQSVATGPNVAGNRHRVRRSRSRRLLPEWIASQPSTPVVACQSARRWPGRHFLIAPQVAPFR